ncbi:cell division control protein 48 homolog C-like protein isoform X2, partial [Tanacetum coccineum]
QLFYQISSLVAVTDLFLYIFLAVAQWVKPFFRFQNPISIPDAVTWEDIGGYAELKATLSSYIVYPIEYPKMCEEFVTGFLLYGPPGCGKTLIANAVDGIVSPSNGDGALFQPVLYQLFKELEDAYEHKGVFIIGTTNRLNDDDAIAVPHEDAQTTLGDTNDPFTSTSMSKDFKE